MVSDWLQLHVDDTFWLVTESEDYSLSEAERKKRAQEFYYHMVAVDAASSISDSENIYSEDEPNYVESSHTSTNDSAYYDDRMNISTSCLLSFSPSASLSVCPSANLSVRLLTCLSVC